MFLSAVVSAMLTDVRFSVEQFAGLNLKVNGVPVLVGSSFQYFDAKTGKGLFSSRWSPKDVAQMPDGSTRVRFGGDNGNVIGTHTFTPTANGVKVRYEFRWRGKNAARVENCLAQIWAPAVSHGSVAADGSALLSVTKPVQGSWETRRIGRGQSFEFQAPLLSASMTLREGSADLYDARGYGQDWAKNDCLLWLGQRGLVVKPNQTTEVVVEWSFQGNGVAPKDPDRLTLEPVPMQDALSPGKAKPVIVPRPKEVQELGPVLDVLRVQAPPTQDTRLFAESLARNWRLDPSQVKVPVRTRLSPTLFQERFEANVGELGVEVVARDQVGIKRGLDAISQWARPAAGSLVLPVGSIKDWASVGKRGVHFFAGAGATDFQLEWARRVLSPLRFNMAVVECSRAQWDVVQDDSRGEWVTKAELAGLFEALRSHAIEPVPLVQSLGHMEWLLEGAHRELAVNPALPYTLDYRKLKAKALIKALWEDVFKTLAPKTVHFGLDEIATRGMTDDTTLPRRLWQLALPELQRVAKANGARTMIWGDMLLAPGQAPDAAHARSADEAEAHRRALTHGTSVCDWHYLASRDPRRYTSLGLWGPRGLVPYAASWYRPDNILGHTQAAITAGAGTLQTTWAGYVTDERAVLRETQQFSAHVLAADAAWSGLASLVANPEGVLRELLWSPRKAFRRESGQSWGSGVVNAVRIGEVGFRLFRPKPLFSPLTLGSHESGQSIQLTLDAPAREIALALDCVGWQREGDPVAKIRVVSEAGETVREVLYGGDVRSPEDERDTKRVFRNGNLSAVRIELADSPVKVKTLVIESTSMTAGLRLHGVTSF